MGSIAPKRINVPDAAPVPAAPYALVDNAHTLLPVSDLVFVDAAAPDSPDPRRGQAGTVVVERGAGWARHQGVPGARKNTHRWNSPECVLGGTPAPRAARRSHTGCSRTVWR